MEKFTRGLVLNDQVVSLNGLQSPVNTKTVTCDELYHLLRCTLQKNLHRTTFL